jgi:5-methylcytosine-specific restriction endonuclease McrA
MKVLVLNSAYMPISVTSLRRGFKLVFLGKAEIIECDTKNPIITSNKEYERPLVIRLFRYVFIQFKKVSLTRENIYKRDNYKCLYCGSNKNLTLDHVYPKSKGGKNKWTNLVTCCTDCNIKKDDNLLSDIDMKLKYEPFKPNYLFLLHKNNRTEWKPYLMM